MASLTPEEQFKKLLQESIAIINEEIERTLQYLGVQCVAKARKRSGEDSWFDDTGNLRSSVGYAIYEHGHEFIRSAFPIVINGVEGKEKGDALITELAKKYSSTYALVVVAAMDYAEYVEALENKDVLASTELWARGVIDEYIQKAVSKAERRINKLSK